MRATTYSELLNPAKYLYMTEEGINTPSYQKFAKGYEDAAYGLVAVRDEIVAEFIERYDATDGLCDVIVVRMSDGAWVRPLAAWNKSEFGIRGGEIAASVVLNDLFPRKGGSAR